MINQQVNGFIFPNSIIDELLPELSESELKCYLVVLRKTKGWNKEEDYISISQFMALTGLSNKSVVSACESLVNRGILEKKIGVRNTCIYAVKTFSSSTCEKSSLVKNFPSTCEKSSQVTSEKFSHTKNNIKNKKDLTNVKSKKATQKPTALALLAEFGITDQLAEDFIELRKAKKAPITQTVLNRLQTQADIAQLPLVEVVAIMIDRNWTGFNANWDWKGESQFSGRAESSSKPKFSDENTTWWKGRTIEIYGDTL